jgi:hypothetical protein
MNSRRTRRFRTVTAACFFTGRFAAAWAVGAESGDAPGLEVEARFVHVTKTQARKAFGSSMSRDGTISELNPEQTTKALQTLVRLKADFFSNPRLVAKLGQHAVAEAVREVRYPTEFEPSKDEPGKLIPVAFETRNAGVTLEVDASMAGGQIKVSVVPKVATFLGFIHMGRFNSGKPVSGPHWMAESLKEGLPENKPYQPVFDFRKIRKELLIRSGENILVSELPINPISKEIGTDDVRTFVFVKGRILPVKNTAVHSQPDSQ